MCLTFTKLTAITIPKDRNPPFFLQHYRQRPSDNAHSLTETAFSMLCCWSDRRGMELCRPHIHCNLSLLTQFSAGSHKVKAANTHTPPPEWKSSESVVQTAAMPPGQQAPGPCWVLLLLTISNSEPTRPLRYSLWRPYSWKHRTSWSEKVSFWLFIVFLIAKTVMDVT